MCQCERKKEMDIRSALCITNSTSLIIPKRWIFMLQEKSLKAIFLWVSSWIVCTLALSFSRMRLGYHGIPKFYAAIYRDLLCWCICSRLGAILYSRVRDSSLCYNLQIHGCVTLLGECRSLHHDIGDASTSYGK